jgi:hypothetical protein
MKTTLQPITARIQMIRGVAVLLDSDLAQFYGVETRVLKQSVRRNRDRFPDDFMFELTKNEIAVMVSQNVIPNKSSLGGATPFAFTQEGVAMLSGLLRSPKAIAVNIGIMRAFVDLRQHAQNVEFLATELKKLERSTHRRFCEIGKVLDALLKQKQQQENQHNRRRIGFKQSDL